MAVEGGRLVVLMLTGGSPWAGRRLGAKPLGIIQAWYSAIPSSRTGTLSSAKEAKEFDFSQVTVQSTYPRYIWPGIEQFVSSLPIMYDQYLVNPPITILQALAMDQ